MTARRVRADYDALDEIAKCFDREAQDTQQTLACLHRDLDVLLDGDWVGRGATEFYHEMIAEVLPRIKRLAEALKEAARTTRDASRIMKQAEDDSARLFVIDWSALFGSDGGATPTPLAPPPGVTVSPATSTPEPTTVPATPTVTPTPAGTPTPSTAPSPYTIQSGDTLWAIAIAHGVTVDQIKAYNGLTSDLIVAGQVINIPPSDYQPAPGSLPTATSGGGSSPASTTAPAPSANDYGAIPALDFSRVRYERGFPEGHNGIDVSNPASTGDVAIYASYKGTIAFYWDGGFTNADNDITSLADNYGWGNSMVVEYKYDDQSASVQTKWQELYGLQSGQSMYVLYGHLAKGFETNLPSDLQVQPGDQLAWMGNTGNSSGEHLHLGVKVGAAGEVKAEQTAEGYWQIKGKWNTWKFEDPSGLGLVPLEENDGYQD